MSWKIGFGNVLSSFEDKYSLFILQLKFSQSLEYDNIEYSKCGLFAESTQTDSSPILTFVGIDSYAVN
jgi:hypothetical protein